MKFYQNSYLCLAWSDELKWSEECEEDECVFLSNGKRKKNNVFAWSPLEPPHNSSQPLNHGTPLMSSVSSGFALIQMRSTFWLFKKQNKRKLQIDPEKRRNRRPRNLRLQTLQVGRSNRDLRIPKVPPQDGPTVAHTDIWKPSHTTRKNKKQKTELDGLYERLEQECSSIAIQTPKSLWWECHSLGIPENNDDRVPTEEHLTDESVLVNRERFLLTFPCLGYLNRTKNWLDI